MLKCESLCEKVERKIEAGIFRPGQPIPSIRKLMEAENLSNITVHKGLKMLVKKGVLERHPSRGFFVKNSNAVQNKTPLSQITCLFPCQNTGVQTFLRGLSKVVTASGDFTIASFFADTDMGKYSELVDKVLNFRPAGLLLNPFPDKIGHLNTERLSASGIPMVLWGTPIKGLAVDRVTSQHDILGSTIAKHIVGQGYRHVRVLFTEGRPTEECDPFVDGMFDILADGGIELNERHIHFFGCEHGYGINPDPYIDAQQYVANMLKSGDKFDVIVCDHEYPAVAAIRAIEAHGLRVPEDIAVISAGRCIFLNATIGRDITSIDLHYDLAGKLAGKILMRRMEGCDEPPSTHYIGGDLLKGDTG